MEKQKGLESSLQSVRDEHTKLNDHHKEKTTKLLDAVERLKMHAAEMEVWVLKGSDPRKGECANSKSPMWAGWTKSVEALYEKMHDPKHPMIAKHFSSKSFPQRNIEKYMNLNKEDLYSKTPFVAVGGADGMKVNDIVEVSKIENADYRVPKLVGQKRVVALRDIPQYTVLGLYMGFMALDTEWSAMFDYSKVDEEHARYLFSIGLDEKDPTQSLVIDPIESKMMDLVLLYINDIRANIEEPEPTAEDKALQNCKFTTVNVYGWPTAMVITTKRIVKGEELLLDYGKAYSDGIKTDERWVEIRKQIKEQIFQTRKILGDIDIEGPCDLENIHID